ncbi:hypothetical protein [Clostridium aciditolerans]|uniref:Uncharacterized protein n=1 Tax=Clostridium aciditolerans TaxID=339861 RepID=A0A934HXE6_9CLOT|nr:hypothetical protein [Clostridium aciditolerans]MBI6871301.1 hypothetical protein [Clostridium aciditolerans]
MNNIIKVQIFGVKEQPIASGCGCSNKGNGCSGCSSKKSSCSGCSSRKDSHSGCGGGCKTSASKTVGDLYNELKKFIEESDVKNQTIVEFIDLDKTKLEGEFERIKDIINRGFEPPITVIDDIVRYYGGISNSLVYKDVKELLE